MVLYIIGFILLIIEVIWLIRHCYIKSYVIIKRKADLEDNYNEYYDPNEDDFIRYPARMSLYLAETRCKLIKNRFTYSNQLKNYVIEIRKMK